MVHTLAAGDLGVMNKTAQTAPNGAIVIDNPFGASNWSTLPNIAIPANAPIFLKRFNNLLIC